MIESLSLRQHQSRTNIDGFVLSKRPDQKNNTLDPNRKGMDTIGQSGPQHTSSSNALGGDISRNGHAQAAVSAHGAAGLQRSDVDEALKGLSGIGDGSDLEPPKKQRRIRITKKGVKRTILILFIIATLVGGYLAVKAFIAGSTIFGGNGFAALFSAGKELQMDSNGRTNVLLFGTSEDDVDHDGADLTDSIMVASVDQKKKTGYLMSVPRDLWVKYGKACSSGYEGKINVAYQCGKSDDDDREGGANFLKGIVEKNFGIDIQYHAQVNYGALRDSVNAVGGVTVQIESDDPRGVLDRNFDWTCKYRCYLVKYPNGPANLNGDQALALARARNAAGGYGLSGGNFDREQYQQKIIIALRDKAASAGTLANPVAVSGLLDSLGSNVRTNFDASEVKTLASLAQDIDANKLQRINLVDEEDPLVTTGNYGGQSIVRPVAGIYDFSDIKATIAAYASGDTALLERAPIDVLNGSQTAGVAQKQADSLENDGYTIGKISNAPSGKTYQGITLYDLSDGKAPGTKGKLEQKLGLTAKKASDLPSGVTTDSLFVIIIGTNGAN